jgi:hypothetical protein
MISPTYASPVSATHRHSYATSPQAPSGSTFNEDLQLATDAVAQSGDTRERFRITGPVHSGNLVALRRMPDALVQEMATREKEEKLREEINFRYAYEHQYKPMGQVLVNGKLFAEVTDGGSYTLAHTMRGLNENDLSPKARVEEIARALKGKGQVEIRYSNLMPGFGGWSGPSAPESALPAFTARSRQEIMQEAMGAR